MKRRRRNRVIIKSVHPPGPSATRIAVLVTVATDRHTVPVEPRDDRRKRGR